MKGRVRLKITTPSRPRAMPVFSREDMMATRMLGDGVRLHIAINRGFPAVTARCRVIRTVGSEAPNVGAAEGCDLLILFLESQSKDRSLVSLDSSYR
ncbi:hypothetical protein D3C72_2176040 [compost metagenome]